MPESKLFHSINCLDQTARQRFLKFLSSPYFNTDNKLVCLTQILFEAGDKFPSRQELDHALFPGWDFDYFRISNLLSYIMKLLERYLVAEEMEAHQIERNLSLLSSARKLNMDKVFLATSRKLKKQFEDCAVAVPGIFFHQYRFEDETNIFSIAREQRQDDSSVDGKLVALDRFYVAEMLKTCCQRINQENIIYSRERPAAMKQFMSWFAQYHEKYDDDPFIRIYFLILNTLINPSKTDHFFDLLKMLDQYGEAIDSDELKPMYQYAQNYCIKQSNQGHTDFLDELLGVFVRMIDAGLIYHNGWISPWDFKNIVALGVRLNRFEWTEGFIEQYTGKLEPVFRENALLFNRAQLHYGRGDFQAAMRLLTQVEFEDVYYFLGAKTLLLKIYYELEEVEALHSFFHSFGEALRRNKTISPYQRKVHHNLIRFLRQLQKLREQTYYQEASSISDKFRKLLKKVENAREITQGEWLKARIHALLAQA